MGRGKTNKVGSTAASSIAKTNNFSIETATSSVSFKFRPLPEGNSRADKNARANRLNMDILAIGERGTWKDLATANGMIEDFYRRKMITKSDYERLNKTSGFAERAFRNRRKK